MTDTRTKEISGTKTILLVEDEGLLRDIVRAILEGCGHRVLEADSGSKALEVWGARDGNIDLLLTDMVMPRGISGMDLARRLLEQKPHLKIIFTTGRLVSDLDRETFEKINARFLQKPFQHSDLVQVVNEALTAP